MGCSGTKTVKIKTKDEDNKIEYKVSDKISEFSTEIQNKFQKFTEMINKLEILRYILIDLRQIIIYKTGACFIKKPTFENALTLFLVHLGIKSNGNIEEYRKALDFETKNCVNCVPDEFKETLEHIYYYLNILYKFDKVNSTIEEFHSLKKDLDDNYDTIRDEITNDANSKKLISKYLLDYLLNIKKFFEKILTKIEPIIVEHYSVDITFIKTLTERQFFAEAKFIENINNYSKEAIKNNWITQYDLAYNKLAKELNSINGESPDFGKNEYENIVMLKINEKRYQRSEEIFTGLQS